MAVKLNSKGKSQANALVASGKVNTADSWSFSADDGNKILGDPPDWKEYAKWFLGIDEGGDPEIKGTYHYPFGKNGQVYRSGLIAIRQRAAQQGETEIYDTAGKLIDKIDGNKKSVPGAIERRYVTVQEIRVVKKSDAAMPTLDGYAAVFNSLSEDLGGFRELIAPGAFKNSIGGDVRALWNHDANHVLGRTKSGTLTLAEDQNGLKINIAPPDAQWARDLMASIDRGDVNQMSFGFRTITDNWSMLNGENLRTLMDVELFDVSPVTFPAYPDTQVALRSLDSWKQSAPPSSGDKGTLDPSIRIGLMRRELEFNDKIFGEVNKS